MVAGLPGYLTDVQALVVQIPYHEKNSSIFSIATTLKRLQEDYHVYMFIPPDVHNYTPPVTAVQIPGQQIQIVLSGLSKIYFCHCYHVMNLL